MAVDRRVLRTRVALYDALVALILERPYAAITVADILERADIGRSTFYAHFTSKDDLLARSLDRLADILRRAADAMPPGADGWSLVLFTHVGEYGDVYLALSNVAAGDILRAAVRGVVADFARGRIKPRQGLPADLAVQHVVATFMTVTTWWLERHRNLPPAETDRLFHELLAAGPALS
ncbi:MAG TPA: helix-turn-helix domain-containing protein [Devosiaceae bacterium]|jgi:AcrR family transcriptional regulator|nr:helix-turn-helix domain-containing protein [Devosiaceae bacterium]